jgi:hypothetical protein
MSHRDLAILIGAIGVAIAFIGFLIPALRLVRTMSELKAEEEMELELQIRGKHLSIDVSNASANQNEELEQMLDYLGRKNAA